MSTRLNLKASKPMFRVVEVEQGQRKCYYVQKRFFRFFWCNLYYYPHTKQEHAMNLMRECHKRYVNSDGKKVKRIMNTL